MARLKLDVAKSVIVSEKVMSRGMAFNNSSKSIKASDIENSHRPLGISTTPSQVLEAAIHHFSTLRGFVRFCPVLVQKHRLVRPQCVRPACVSHHFTVHKKLPDILLYHGAVNSNRNIGTLLFMSLKRKIILERQQNKRKALQSFRDISRSIFQLWN